MKKIKSGLILLVIAICFLLIAGYFQWQMSINQHLIKGLIYEDQSQFEEAIEEYEKGDNSVPVLSKIATLYNWIGERDKAVGMLKKIIEIDKDHVEAHFDLARTYRAMGQLEDAIEEYETVLKLNPQSVVSLNSLGNIHYDQGNVDKAIEYYQRAIAINPNFAPVHNDLGNAYHSQGKIEEAITEYKKALSLDVDFNLARQNLRLAEEELQKH